MITEHSEEPGHLSDAVDQFSVRTERPGADTIVVRACGEVDLETNPELSAGIAAAIAQQPAVLVLDLTGVSFCSSCGLMTMVAAERECRAQGIGFSVALSRRVRRVVEVTGLDTVLTLVTDLPG